LTDRGGCGPEARGRTIFGRDGIVRSTHAKPLDGRLHLSLIGIGHRFGKGHRLRVQVAGGAHPRFARKPGNGDSDAPISALRPMSGMPSRRPCGIGLTPKLVGGGFKVSLNAASLCTGTLRRGWDFVTLADDSRAPLNERTHSK
jgi:X-Pro dipeptidyl-peptidase C-terminal non-catalytic domain